MPSVSRSVRCALLVGLASVLFPLSILAETDQSSPATVQHSESESSSSAHDTPNNRASDGHSFLVGALLYVPNRVLDLLDIFRLRVRVGPGVAAGVRATELVDAFVGSYVSVYAGLPGPRMSKKLPLPVGLESKSGVEVSVADATVGGGIGPDYSSTEFGLGGQVLIVGFDAGFDPMEIVDFFAGFLTIDLRDDDL